MSWDEGLDVMKLGNLIRGNDRGATTLRLVTCVSLLLTSGVGALGLGTAASAAPPDKITICHATGSANNPYITNRPSKSADVGGHDGHNGPVFDGVVAAWGDIIPVFTFVDGNGVAQTYPGKNWTGNTLAQEIYANSCNMVTPDLRLLKSSSGNAVAGTSGTYTLAVTNIGTRTATGPLTVSDTMPLGVVATGATGAGWTCTLGAAGASVSCTNPASLAPTLSTANIVVAVDWVAPGSKVNSATVQPVTHETATSNNTGRNTTVIRPAVVVAPTPDLQLTKTTTGNAVVGTTGSYYIDVENVGLGNAVGSFTVTDTMPAGVVATSAAGVGWVCTVAAGPPAGGSLSCDHAADLAGGASAGQITVGVDWSTTGLKSNTAQVSTVVGDTEPGNNSDTVQSTVSAAPVPDLQLLKTSSAGAVAGGTGSYFVDVDNVGSGVADGPFSVVDTMPTGVVATAASGTGWTCTVPAGGASVSCDHAANLAGNTSAGLITVSVTWTTAGPKNNRATVGAVPGEVDTANNTDDVDTVVSAAPLPPPPPPPPPPPLTADLAVDKAGPASLLPGGLATWILTVTNKGPGAASGFTVTDTVPAGVTLSSLSGSAPFSCSLNSAACTYSGSLAAGGTAVVTAAGTLASSFTASSISNVVTVAPTDATPGDNTDTLVTAVQQPAAPGQADLVLDKAAPAAAVLPGDPITWTITVTNAGTANASGFTVTDPLALGLTLVQAAGEGFTCSGAGVACTYAGTLGPNQVATLLVTAALAEAYTASSVANTASAPLAGDPTPSNNTDTATTTVNEALGGAVEEPVTAEEPAEEPTLAPIDGVDEEPALAPRPRALPFTGASADSLLALAASLSLAGLTLALMGRRRRTAE